MTPLIPPAEAPSLTDMSRCIHGPVFNCPRCLNGELMGALEWDSAVLTEVLQKSEPAGEGWFKVPPGVLTTLGELDDARRALIDKAKAMGDAPDEAVKVAKEQP